MIFLIWAVLFVAAFVLYLRKKYSLFSDYGVPHFKPVPILGNVAPLMLRKNHVSTEFNKLYEAFSEARFVGRYEIIKPTIILRDLELIKKITVKDFEHFLDHRAFVNDTIDPLFGRNLFSLRGQEWKDMRSTLSPAFTSSKIRQMVPFMVEVNDQMIRNLKKQLQESQEGYVDIDCKDLTTRYTNDVIATCAFGVKVDSHTEKSNEFYAMGKSTATFGFRRVLIFLGYSSIPFVMKHLNIKLFSDKINNFFKNLVLRTMEDRETRNIIRPDMIHLLMEAKKGKLTHEEKATSEPDTGFATVEESDVGKKNVFKSWTDNDLVAQAVLFFVAGFETVSSAMSFMMHELAVNPDVQDKLYQEISENVEKTGGKFDYNSIQNLQYMDMVVSELLRLWPPAVGLDRMCIKDYNLGRASTEATKDYIVRKGDAVVVPTWSLHHNPDYFPDPYKFDPERFSDENKHNIKPFTYMPFGTGPRNCIGSRFALCEVKVMAYQLLQQFEVTPCEKTRIPAQLSTDTFNLLIKGGHWIRLKVRK